MKTGRNRLALALLLFAAASPCFGLVLIADVSKERAKEMGVTLRSHLNGDAGVAVWLEFKTQGALKDFTHVDLQITAEGKSLVRAVLRVERTPAGIVSANFSADPAWLATSTLTIRVHDGERNLIGYRLKVKDFIEPAKPR